MPDDIYGDAEGKAARLLSTTDAAVWTDEWLRTIAEHPDIPTDWGTMVGWFANAIGVGRTAELHLAGVVDPAEHSDRAVAVFEMPDEDYHADSASYLIDQLERETGMRCLVVVDGRFTGVEEPSDG